MSFTQEYQKKLTTADQAVKESCKGSRGRKESCGS